MKQYRDFLKGKSVALIASGGSLKGKGHGSFIDSFDVVIRLNRALPLSEDDKDDVGTRTDILYNCLKEGDRNGGKIDIRLWEKNGIKFISSPYPMLDFSKDDIESFIRKNNGRLRFHKFPVKLYKLLEAELGTRPNTGFLAIIDLLFFNIKSLYVTGITFGIDGYYKEYLDISLKEYMKMANGKNHKQNPQFLYIKNKIFNIDNRFVPDNTLKYILKNRKRV